MDIIYFFGSVSDLWLMVHGDVLHGIFEDSHFKCISGFWDFLFLDLFRDGVGQDEVTE